MIACDVDDKFLIATYIFVDGVLSIFPPATNGEIFIEVESPVVTTSAITPLPAAGSSPTLREASDVLDALSVYSLNHPAVDSPTFYELWRAFEHSPQSSLQYVCHTVVPQQ